MSSNLIVPNGSGGFVEKPPAAVENIGRAALTALNKAYPDWKDGWKVSVDLKGGIIQVRNLYISGKMGFLLHLQHTTDESIVTHAGELLERYNVSRDRNTNVVEAISNLKRNRKGEAIHDE